MNLGHFKTNWNLNTERSVTLNRPGKPLNDLGHLALIRNVEQCN